MSASKIFKYDAAHKDAIWTACWAKHGADNLLLTGSCDETVGCWEIKEDGDAKENISLKHVFPDHSMGAVSIVCSPTNPLAISSSMDSRIRILDISNVLETQEGSVKATIDAGPVECWTLACSPGGDFVASGTHTGAVNIWDLETCKLENTVESSGGSFVLSVAYSPDGSCLAAGSKDGTIRIFDLNSNKLIHGFTNHTMPVRSLSFSPDSSTLFSACDDLTVSIYDVKKKAHTGTLRGHMSWVVSVDTSPDNRYLATSSSDNTVKLWDAVERTCVQTFDKTHSDQVHAVAFNRAGNRLASVGGEGNLQIYSVSVPGGTR